MLSSTMVWLRLRLVTLTSILLCRRQLLLTTRTHFAGQSATSGPWSSQPTVLLVSLKMCYIISSLLFFSPAHIMTELLLHVNSAMDRRVQDTSTSTWTTYLSQTIKTSSNSTIQLMIDNIDFPNSLYTFPEYASTLWWIHDYGGANEIRSITLDINRVYDTGADVATALDAAMLSAGYSLYFTFSSLTYKLTVQNKEDVPIRLIGSYRYSDSTNVAFNNICDRLGFTQDMTNTPIANMAILSGAGVVRTLRSSCYYITADILSNKISQSQFPNPYNQPSVLGRVSASNFGSLSQLQIASSVFFKCSGTTVLDKIVFSVLDDELIPITDLLGMPVCFSLRILIS